MDNWRYLQIFDFIYCYHFKDEDCVNTYGWEGLQDENCDKEKAFICESYEKKGKKSVLVFQKVFIITKWNSSWYGKIRNLFVFVNTLIFFLNDGDLEQDDNATDGDDKDDGSKIDDGQNEPGVNEGDDDGEEDSDSKGIQLLTCCKTLHPECILN